MNTKFNIGDNIAYYRKQIGLTQEQLAEILEISNGAVSKWEQKISSPDVMLLPAIADLFQISIDELFGRAVNREPVFDFVEDTPWKDDRKIRVAFYHGKKLITHTENNIHSGKNQIILHFDYPPYQINGFCKFVSNYNSMKEL